MFDILIIVTTLVLFILPFFPSIKETFWGVDTRPTVVTDKQLQDLRDSSLRIWSLINFKKPNHYREIHQNSLAQEYVDTCYCFGSLSSGNMNKVWELHVENNFDVVSPLTVAWWLTADRIAIKAPTISVGKMQAHQVISISEKMEFHHIQAPKILVGNSSERNSLFFESAFNRSRKIVHHDMVIPMNTVITENLIIHGDLILEENVLVEGSLKVWGSLLMKENSSVRGDVFVTQNAELLLGSSILGVVVVEKKLQTRGDNSFGHSLRQTTVVAQEVVVMGSLLLHGSLKAWQYGEIQTIGDRDLHDYL